MKTRQTKSADASESKSKVKKRVGENSGPTLSKKLRERKDGETSKEGMQP